MRVIWISLGLLATFLVALGVVYEPTPDQQQLAATDNAGVGNPFVEESVEETNDKGGNVSSDKAVDLAVLPANAESASAQLNPQPQVSNDSTVVESATQSETVQDGGAVAQAVTAQVSVDAGTENLEAKNIENIVVAKPEVQDRPEKKLGLAMLEFEKQKKKNKVAVIVHETNPQKLTEKEIKALYLDRLTRWQDGSKVMLYNLPLGDKHRDKFSESVLNMTALEADTQESKRRELRIKANDVQVKAKNVVVSYVEQHPNAVAYVPLDLVREKSNVKVVLTIP